MLFVKKVHTVQWRKGISDIESIWNWKFKLDIKKLFFPMFISPKDGILKWLLTSGPIWLAYEAHIIQIDCYAFSTYTDVEVAISSFNKNMSDLNQGC